MSRTVRYKKRDIEQNGQIQEIYNLGERIHTGRDIEKNGQIRRDILNIRTTKEENGEERIDSRREMLNRNGRYRERY